ncbi:hypothetical protein AMAG_19466 [Allomyces macrogynus ATCC 38327]|uniref:Uncharacterized protein n=1 Tax=Allomyces macrogynus (strain ATCC 38327) TaxID=578462 RepID=A0A0L0SSA6_ALLM3|nr:hypothetical protein AMAG_19466 [Allomyces macrogynus ATCC 38327]|eukprot:KNE65438.1 hypothetical protein AMAG_19466 [Allomyces macrogynus ATCC 38327]
MKPISRFIGQRRSTACCCLIRGKHPWKLLCNGWAILLPTVWSTHSGSGGSFCPEGSWPDLDQYWRYSHVTHMVFAPDSACVDSSRCAQSQHFRLPMPPACHRLLHNHNHLHGVAWPSYPSALEELDLRNVNVSRLFFEDVISSGLASLGIERFVCRKRPDLDAPV